MATAKYNDTDINCVRGDKESKTYTVTQAGTTTAYNLSGYTITAEARPDYDGGPELFSITITDSQDGNVFSTGTVVLVIPAATTKTLPEICYYDVQAVSGSTTLTIARGKITTHPDVTR